MIKIKEAKLIHNMLISRFGGIEGIRDEEALESALKRPYSPLTKQIYTLIQQKRLQLF